MTKAELMTKLNVLELRVKVLEDTLTKMEAKSNSDREQMNFQITKESRYAREIGKKKI